VLLLHISDLHVTHKEESLNNVWASANRKLKKMRFDFIVVSGDLSNDGINFKETEFFAKRVLLNKLRKKEKNRIIFVPGNHDVNWSVMDDISKKIPFSTYADKKKIKIVKECKKLPFKTSYRLNISDLGEAELYKINEKLYSNRFSNLQSFLDRFYGNGTSSEGQKYKQFKLISNTPGQDWSAHIFKEDKIAFFGFNSCFRNDKYWTGARICYDSIDKASKYAERNAKNCQLVALWHHGLQGTEYRPDCLSYSDIGRLYNAGFRIGFHGHIHQSRAQEIREFLDERFLIIATGSLGAEQSDRPGSVGNQFSIIHLTPGHAEVETYQREKHNQIRNIFSKDYIFKKFDDRVVPHKADTHTRSYEIRPDGITKVNVKLENFENPSGANLAVLTPPYCHYDYDSKAKAGAEYLNINSDSISDGRIRFFITTNKKSLNTIKWNYRFSNGIALNRSDIKFRKFSKWLPKLPNGCEGWPYTVRFLTKKLILNLKYPSNIYIDESSLIPFAEREVKNFGTTDWVHDRDESKRCEIKYNKRNKSISLSIDSPQIGYSYSIAYKLKPKGNVIHNSHLLVSSLVLNLCRNNFFSHNSYCSEISKAVVNTLNNKVDHLLHGSTLIGLLWSKDESALLPAFGCFPCQSWSLRFYYGEGVAGHCFRFSKITRWTSDQKSIIFKPDLENSQTISGKRWIICIPLYIRKSGPSIGVFSIEENEADKNNTEKLLSLINAARKKDKNAVSYFDKIETALNSAFWQTLLRLDILEDTHLNYKRIARNILKEFRR
jgi:predicted phosphodiesterase